MENLTDVTSDIPTDVNRLETFLAATPYSYIRLLILLGSKVPSPFGPKAQWKLRNLEQKNNTQTLLESADLFKALEKKSK